ncbi:hypothetical protein DV515_00002995 [Chloebia gouldiae]|uniref:Uncharacterized protein n=1 Tax=Chloebia gouldiae TaxID=44316 RepID=A0A3L8SVC4_CHLGU|nr:hypothetical protein DV515_00002995 [Chloebia gouldiae]
MAVTECVEEGAKCQPAVTMSPEWGVPCVQCLSLGKTPGLPQIRAQYTGFGSTSCCCNELPLLSCLSVHEAVLKDSELSFPTLFQFFPVVPLKRILQERHRDDQTAGWHDDNIWSISSLT